MSAPQLLDIDDSVLLVIDMQAHLAAAIPAEAWQGARDGAVLLARAATELDLPALARMRAAGVASTNRESVIFEWLRDARYERFKSMFRLLQ